MINDNEHLIIDEISRRSNLTQRELAGRTRLSLGAVNLILKRLIRRGFVKTRNLTPKKVEYLLTSNGLAHKTQKSFNYIFKTINLVKFVKAEIARLVLEEYNRGQKKFIILGNDDLADIIELALKGFEYQRVNSAAEISDAEALVLIGTSGSKANGFRAIDLGERLGELYWGVELKEWEK